MLAQAIKKPHKIIGKEIVLRNVDVADAEFIVALRNDPEIAKYLSPVDLDVDKQRKWIEAYQKDETQAYFIIENEAGIKFGTIRLYAPKGDKFCWGSWALRHDRPDHFAIKSLMMLYQFALGLGFYSAYFEARKWNLHVCQFYEHFGAVKIREDDLNNYYEISNKAIRAAIAKYEKYLPHQLEIIYCPG